MIRKLVRSFVCSMLALAALVCTSLGADELPKLVLTSPTPYQVFQRESFEAATSHDHHKFGPTMGYTDVVVEGSLPEGIKGQLEFRVTLVKPDSGPERGRKWMPLNAEFDGQSFHGPAEVNAGGWYRLAVRCVEDGKTLAEGSVEPFGVGEVFIVAGQSYAAGANDELLKVNDEQGRVSAYDVKTKKWQLANDPQPNVGDGGTIWPALGDLLAPTLRVPVGFVNVAVGGTSTKQWMPEGDLHKQLVAAGHEIGTFRAVLWQQGESDVIEKTTTETYIKNMNRIRESAARVWRFEPTWLLAKSTLHPTVYNDAESAKSEENIRNAIQQLWKRPHFAPGPDTDLLSGENRGDEKSRRHFSGIGQRRAALLWFVAVWNEIERQAR